MRSKSVGKLPLDVETMGVDLLSLSAHKLYGPKGAGALWIRRGIGALVPLVFGGGQEKKRRGGTENVAGIVGLGRAAEIAAGLLEEEADRVRRVRDQFLQDLKSRVPGVKIHGDPDKGLPNTLSFAVEGVSGQSLLVRTGCRRHCRFYGYRLFFRGDATVGSSHRSWNLRRPDRRYTSDEPREGDNQREHGACSGGVLWSR